ncbi:AbrB/MazE/SpoVT family DNA-binding domain-containing protein [Priestia abyssalis]|uniref:AbrB/MazE/SpoVT family DNA-binding domain-containing protein n=1 Tax=Priestia abyssalis TaxID=1221450 RepID=UPI000994DE11|nr:AbrB/MazE/SpoVT family DNA-binding domain-containing protein [Priestia abyssalis]
MKSTGIVRKMDELGRVVLPKELRRILDIEKKDPLEIFVDEELIILKKYKPYRVCQVTGEVSERNLSFVNGKVILSPEGAGKLVEEIQQTLMMK